MPALLLQQQELGKVDPARLVTHRLKLDDILEAYEIFGNAAREKAIKFILTA